MYYTLIILCIFDNFVLLDRYICSMGVWTSISGEETLPLKYVEVTTDLDAVENFIHQLDSLVL